MREQRRGGVGPDEIRDWVVFALEASTDNNNQQICLLLARLLETPELWDEVRRAPDLVPAAVEESLRLDARPRVLPRQASESIETGTITIRAGTDVFLWIRAAHLDPRAFDRPKEFDLHRPPTPGTLIFGGGAYSCLGQWMARTEMQEALRAVIDRFPRIQLAGPPERAMDLFSLGAKRLPVVLGGTRSS